MSYKFLCPNGHLLEAEEHEQGAVAACPGCGAFFIIPAPAPGSEKAQAQACSVHVADKMDRQSAEPEANPHSVGTGGKAPSLGATSKAASTAVKRWSHQVVSNGQDAGNSGGSPAEVLSSLFAEQEAKLFHVRCCAGHILEVSKDMFGNWALCPACKQKLFLREEDTLEYRRRKAEEQRRRLERQSRFWLQFSIVTAAVIMTGLMLLLAMSIWG